MVGRSLLARTQAMTGMVEPKVVDLLALPEPMPPRAQRRRTLGKSVLPVQPRDRSDRSSEPLLSSSSPFPPGPTLLPVSPLIPILSVRPITKTFGLRQEAKEIPVGGLIVMASVDQGFESHRRLENDQSDAHPGTIVERLINEKAAREE
jgi:hypothetical protein